MDYILSFEGMALMALKNKQGWVIVDGVHCCYCQLADYACPTHSNDMQKEYYAVVRWSTVDVHDHRENMGWVKWTDEEAERWLASMEGNIQDRMTERGWDVIDTLMEE